MTKSIVKLTDEQEKFWNYLLMRVTNEDPALGQPWAARGFFKMTPVSAPGLGTMAIDKRWIVYIDFDFFIPKGIIYAAGVLHHEVWHPLRNFHERAERMPEPPEGVNKAILNNIAGDLEINHDILHLLPPDSIKAGSGTFSHIHRGFTHEEYYDILSQKPELVKPFQPPQISFKKKDKNKDKQDGDKGDQSQPGDQPGDQGQGSQPGDGTGDQSGQGTGKPQRGFPGGKPGGFPGGAPGQKPEPGNQPGQNGDPSNNPGDKGDQQDGDGTGSGQEEFTKHGERTIMGCGPLSGDQGDLDEFLLDDYDIEINGVGLSEEESELLKRQIADDVLQFPSTGVGSQISGARGWAEKILAHTPVDWRQTLRASIKNAIAYKRGKVDYTWKRPARRQPSPDLLRPGLQQPKVRIGIAIDKSGSNLGNLALVIDEVEKIMKSIGVRGQEVQAFAVDVQADKSKPVNDPKKILEDVNVGGGTRMTPGYIRLGELDVDIALLFTDAYVDDWPKTRPNTKNKSMKYYTICVVPEGTPGDALIKKAGKYLDSWGKIIDIRLTRES